jgi:hypothetical protein
MQLGQLSSRSNGMGKNETPYEVTLRRISTPYVLQSGEGEYGKTPSMLDAFSSVARSSIENGSNDTPAMVFDDPNFTIRGLCRRSPMEHLTASVVLI